MANNNIQAFEPSDFKEGSQIDFKRILFRALRNWYWILISVLLALSGAFFLNRYSIPIYQVSTSIIIGDSNEGSEGERLYKNPMVSSSKNYYNEIYIIKSLPLIQRVIEDLNFDVVFYTEGNILTIDAYSHSPVEGEIISSDSPSKKIMMNIVDKNQYRLKTKNGEEHEGTFQFNDTIDFAGVKLIIYKKNTNGMDPSSNDTYTIIYTDPALVARQYAGKLDASWAELGASVVNLSSVGSNAEREKDFLNGLVHQYQETDLQKKNETAIRSIEFISNQLRIIRDSLHFFEIQLEKFKNENVITDLSGEALRLFQKLEIVEGEKRGLLVNENYYKYLLKYISENKDFEQIILPSAVGISDNVLSSLISQLVNLQLEIKMYVSPENLQNPRVTARQRMIDNVRKDILESLDVLKSTDRIKLNEINKRIADVEKQLSYLPVAERRLVSIQRNYTLLDNLYVFLMQKKAEAEISNASSTSDIMIVNPPVSSGQIAPKKSQNYSIAFLIGLLLPFGIFALVEFMNTKVQSKEDIDKITSIPFIGGVGHNQIETNLVVSKKPKSSVAESFRALRSNINYFTGNEDKKIIMVTSSISGEGKTFTSINLATVFAFSGKKTLIIGADMRRPRLFNDFKVRNEIGLSNYLSGLNELKDGIQSTEIENLFILGGGPVPPNPSELLLKDKVLQMFNDLKRNFDYIIVDTPPVALVTDAFVLSKYADHILYVVRQNYTPKNTLGIIQDYYRDGRIKNISIFLNDIYKSGPGYGYSNYSYGYYYSEKNKKNGGYYED